MKVYKLKVLTFQKNKQIIFHLSRIAMKS